jgi:beta-glucanase (GH16 family)
MGDYDPATVLSVPAGSSYLDYAIHATSGRGKVAAPLPNGYTPQTYGRYSVRFRSDYLPGYKIAYLLWPVSENWNEGEIDWPEGNLNGPVGGGSAVRGSFDGSNMTFDPVTRIDTATDTQDWHIATIEWTPGLVQWFWDGVLIDQTTNPDGVPITPMRWVLQAETNTDSEPINTAVTGHVQVDWVAIWEMSSYDPTQFFPFFG